VAGLPSRKSTSFCKGTYYLVGRVFRQVELTNEVVKLLVFVIFGFVGGLGGLLGEWSWSALPGNFSGPSTMAALFLGIQHRNDYGDEKLILRREVNAGVSVFAVFVGKFLLSSFTVLLKMFTYSLVLYILVTPQQSFGTFLAAYYLYGLWWAAMAQFLSVVIKDQITVIIIAMILPALDQLQSGFFCVPQVAETHTFCPREGSDGSGFWPGYPFFIIQYAAEMSFFPNYVANLSIPNATNYWYSSDLIDLTEDITYNNATGTEISITAFIFDEGDTHSAVGQATGLLILRNIFIRLMLIVGLLFQVTANTRRFRNFFGRINRLVFGVCGVCQIPQFQVPADELKTVLFRREFKEHFKAELEEATTTSTTAKESV